ncbi:MAG: FAD-dependent oxidoreductase [Planctomycetaceae bacterium]
MSKRVIVIGGGVIGTACAYYLQQSGCDVTIVEQKTIGSGASHANCGFVCPSHVLPLAGPGVMGKTLKAMLSTNSPFSIKPRFDPALWSWLLRFASRCNTRDMLDAGQAIHALLKDSRQRYADLIAAESLDVEWQTRGLLFPFLTQQAMDHYAHTDHLLGEHFGVHAVRYDGEAAVKLEPALKPGLAGAWHYEGDAHLRPDKLMSAWGALLKSRGVAIHENSEFRGFETSNRQVTQVVTSTGTLPADQCVIATGAWTPMLNHQLKCHIAIQPGKGYSMTMARPANCPTTPLIFEEHRVAVTPMASGYRLGSIMEFSGYDATISPKKMEMLRAGARHYLFEPTAEPVLEQWYGWRPMTPNSLPIIDRPPAFDNVLVAAGHNMLGLSMATGTGRLVADLLTDQKPQIDPRPYAALRRVS